MTRLASFCLASALCAATGVPGFAETRYQDAEAISALKGTWASSGPEDWGRGTYGFRTFTFNDGNWSLDFTLAVDPAMKVKVFEFHTTGTYEVQAPSQTVPGAFEMLFREDKKALTLRATDPGMIQGFGLAECNLTPDVKTDISATGCAIWKPVSVCGEDYDLLALDEQNKLYFGVRPGDNDMCTPDKRPTALLPAVVRQ